MAEQGPITLFLGKWAKGIFAEAGSNKTLTVQGKITAFDEQSIVFERSENPNKVIRVYVNRDKFSHIKQEEVVRGGMGA